MASLPHILLVEDEPAIADTLLYALKTENFEATHLITGNEALLWLEGHRADLIVLDVGLPDLTGFDLCQKIRNSSLESAQSPLLFLTARDSEIDQILGLELGGDDYVTKPFSPRAVVARIRALLRRSQASTPQSSNDSIPSNELLHHCENTMSIYCHGQLLDLTAHEYKLLSILLTQPKRVFTREQLLIQAWDDPGSAMDRTIDAHIKSLRSKLRIESEEAADTIQTRRGLGYTLVI